MSFKRSIDDIKIQPLNHDSGTKKVLFNYQDFDTPCRQISVATFNAGDVCEEHVHPTLDEHFYWEEGEGFFTINGENVPFAKGDYIYVPANTSHSIKFEKTSRCMCIGIALDWKNPQK